MPRSGYSALHGGIPIKKTIWTVKDDYNVTFHQL